MRFEENCVYAVDTPSGIKIGFTSRLGDRLIAFQKKHECACYPVALIKGLSRKDAMKTESTIHGIFHEWAMGNEYFAVSKNQVLRVFIANGSGIYEI